MTVTCEYCGTKFNKPPCHVARVTRQFCNNYCYNIMQFIDSLLTGHRVIKTCVSCGEDFTIEATFAERFSTCADNRSCSRKRKSGSSNPNWRGGVTSERKAAMSRTEYKDWRKAVFERDNYTCVDCEKRGGDLEADHIKPWAYYPELRYVVENGRTLCESCHHNRMWEVFKHRPERKELYGMVRLRL